jgi:hypothetical protein
VGLFDEVIKVAVPAVIEIGQKHEPAAVVHESPVGKVNRAHAAEIAVGRDHPQNQAKPEMAGPEQRHTQHTRLDQHNAPHVILRDPVLATDHLAELALIDRRRVMM